MTDEITAVKQARVDKATGIAKAQHEAAMALAKEMTGFEVAADDGLVLALLAAISRNFAALSPA